MKNNQQVDLEVFNEDEYPENKKVSNLPDWPHQSFHVSHLDDDSFKTPGFRPWSLSRDLGMIEATGGMVDAHVNRRARPFNGEEISHRHFHNVQKSIPNLACYHLFPNRLFARLNSGSCAGENPGRRDGRLPSCST